jgi:hypothetical protein
MTPGPGAAAGLVDNARAETHARLLAEDQLRRALASPRYRWLHEDFQAGGQPPVEVGLHRVSAVLSALRQVGALSRATAARLFAEFADALAARGLHDPRGLASPAPPGQGPAGPAPAGPGGPAGTGDCADETAAQPGSGAPGGRYLAVPVGAVIPAEWDGHQGEVHVLALVLAPDRAAISTSFVSSWREAAAAAGGPGSPQPSFPPFGGSGVTDDQGRRYRLTLEIAGGGWHETGVLVLSAVPPPGTRWLEMPVSPARSIRIDLTGAPLQVRHEHHPAPPLGELLLGAVAETMLGGGQLVGITATLLASGLAEVADALTAVCLLAPDSPAACHLAALCTRRAIEVRGPWAGRARASGLPGPWVSVLSGSRRVDGPQGTCTATAVLPEIDGARFVLAGLSSWERHATVLVFAWGWSPRPREFRAQQPFSWWARDDADRWHVGRIAVHNAAPGTFQLELTPPLHPAARSLDIILTGRDSQVTATLPLAWPGRLAEPQDQDISY